MAVKLNEMENKQTAVEWLVEQFDLEMFDTFHLNKINYAKQLEKQQIVDAVDGHPIQNRNLDGEQYYSETYGKD